MEKVSVVVTVKNDQSGIKTLLSDLEKQTVRADEVIVIAAAPVETSPLPWSTSMRRGVGSTGFGRTSPASAGGSSERKIKVVVINAGVDCTRGKGRNLGIKRARNEIIAVTDVGCRPHKDWLQKLTTPLFNKEVDVVSGFYKTIAKTDLQKAIAPYLAVMPSKWNENYLPASRSIGFMKSVWKKVGGYPEEAESGTEDLEFSRRLRDEPGIKIKQVPQALVDWEVPNNLADFRRDISKHTLGNFEVGYRPHIKRNLSVPVRWILFIIWPWLIPFYLLWPIFRHFGEVDNWRARACLPVVQMVSDMTIVATIAVWGLEKLRSKVSAGSAD